MKDVCGGSITGKNGLNDLVYYWKFSTWGFDSHEMRRWRNLFCSGRKTIRIAVTEMGRGSLNGFVNKGAGVLAVGIGERWGLQMRMKVGR